MRYLLFADHAIVDRLVRLVSVEPDTEVPLFEMDVVHWYGWNWIWVEVDLFLYQCLGTWWVCHSQGHTASWVWTVSRSTWGWSSSRWTARGRTPWCSSPCSRWGTPSPQSTGISATCSTRTWVDQEVWYDEIRNGVNVVTVYIFFKKR